MRVLLIDQTVSFYEQFQTLLTASGVRFSRLDRAAELTDVVELINSCTYDLCFLDLRMTRSAILSVVGALPGLAIIVLIGNDEYKDDKEECDSLMAYLPKDALNPMVLARAIRLALRNVVKSKEINEEQNLFQLTQESAGIGTWTWDLISGQVSWSANLYKLFGLPATISNDQLYEYWINAIHPDDRAAAQAAATVALAGCAPLQSRFRILKPGTDEIRWIECHGEVVRDGAGRPTRFIGINIDITRQEEALAALHSSRELAIRELRDSETRFRTYFDSTPDCMFHLRVEADGRFVYEAVNPAGLAAAGLSLEAVHGRTPEELLGPDKSRMMIDGLRRVQETGQPYRYRPTWEMATGSVTYDAVYMPLRDGSGALTGILGVARDITESLHLENALNQSQKMEALGQLASGVAHDFNNLLAVFQGCLHLISREVHSDNGRRCLAEGMRSIERGKSLTDWLLGFSRQQSASLTPTDLNAAVEDMMDMVTRSVNSGVHVRQQFTANLWLADADRNQTELAVLNVVLNARDAMPLGGQLTIETRNETIVHKQADGLVPGDYAVVEISDTGKGMTPEVLARVLEPFYTTKASGKGTGLGLTMVSNIMRQFGGGVRITSAVGRGTSVSLYFSRSKPREIEADNATISGFVAPTRNVSTKGF